MTVLFIGCYDVDMSESEKEFASFRKEMCSFLHGEGIHPTVQMEDEKMLSMAESLNSMEQERLSLWMQGSLVRHELNNLPIGSVLF